MEDRLEENDSHLPTSRRELNTEREVEACAGGGVEGEWSAYPSGVFLECVRVAGGWRGDSTYRTARCEPPPSGWGVGVG